MTTAEKIEFVLSAKNYYDEVPPELKDKNDKEIYEGDIVKTIYIDNDKFGEIIFHAETGAYRVKTKGRLLPIVTCRFIEDKTPYLQPITDEIVGNIFQNPELLK